VQPTPSPAFARTPPTPEPAPPRPLTPSRPAGAEPAVLSPLDGGAGDARFRRGRLIHQLLQVLPEVAPDERDAVCRRFLARPAHGLGPDAQAEIVAGVLAVLADARFAPLFGPPSRAEVPLVGVVDGRVVAGQVDRLLVNDERVLVVDFKTNRPAPEREEDVPQSYYDQMRAYRAVLSQVYPDRPIDCALLWTDGPRLMPLMIV
jgi:ATP-dependent helicase/nuclease subunit A